MGDGELVQGIARGDLQAIADAHDSYAQDLFDYCQSQLGEAGEADRVLEDTFVVAWARAAELRSPDRLRTWLFAVARRCCHLRLLAGARPAYAGDMPQDDRDLGGDPDWTADLLWATWSALATMNEREREVVELSLRYDLDAADLAEVLGVHKVRARALAMTTKGRFESAADLLLATVEGRPWSCEAARVMFASLNGDAGRVSSRWLRMHAMRCKICAERRKNHPGAGVVMRLLPAATLSGRERQRLLRLLPDDAPRAVAYREKIVDRIGPYNAQGYPERAAPPQLRWRGSYVLAGAAAVVAVALLGGGAALVDAQLSNQSGPAPVTTPSTTAPASTPAVTPEATTSSATVTSPPVTPSTPPPPPVFVPAPQVTSTPKATKTPRPKATSSPSPTDTPTSTPSAPSTPSDSPSAATTPAAPDVVASILSSL